MSVARRRRGSSKSEDGPATTTSTLNLGNSSANYSLLQNDGSDKENSIMGRDRTSEFHSALRSLQGRAQTRPLQPGVNGLGYPNHNKNSNRNLEQYAEFMRIARQIGKHISNTYTKLEKLALLAKRKSLFDDKSVEIQELTFIIKDDINSLNKSIAMLQSSAKGKNTQNGKHLQSHSSGVVVGLQSKLASMSNEFKQVLQTRTENLKEQRNRHEQFSQGPVASSLPPSAMAGFHRGSVLIDDDSNASSSGAGGMNSGDNQALRYRQTQLTAQDDTDTYLEERAGTMRDIEQTIVELGGIFQQLAFMVKEQEEVVHRIDSNVEDAEMNVEAAHTEILKYFKSVASNRWLMIKVFALLIFFFLVFVIFLT